MSEGTGACIERRILVIDDERDIATIIEKYLSRKGFVVTAYVDPELALAHFSIEQQEYDLVLCDINMPKLNGFAVAHRIKKRNPKTKVVLMTAMLQDEWRREKIPDDIDAIIDKPVRLSSLAEQVIIINNVEPTNLLLMPKS
jgi:CheY-like chemotaxis protein